MIPPFEILGKTFAIYPLLAMVGIFVAGGFACRQTNRRGLDDNDMIVLLLVAAIGVLVGSHLLYALTHPSLTWQGVRTLFTQGITQDTWTQLMAAFGGSVFNLAITTILYPPNYSTLPVYISDSYNDLNFGYAAAATIVGGTFIVAIMLLLEVILNLGKRKRYADHT